MTGHLGLAAGSWNAYVTCLMAVATVKSDISQNDASQQIWLWMNLSRSDASDWLYHWLWMQPVIKVNF